MDNNRKTLLVVLIVLSVSGLLSQTILRSDQKFLPHHAGVLYPKDNKTLTGQISSFLNQAHVSNINESPSAIIVPSGSYMYVGGLMADAYRQVQNQGYDAIIIIAPDINNKIDGASIFPGRFFRSPMGVLTVNEGLVRKIIESEPDLFQIRSDGFPFNSYIETQLPFIQYLFGNPDIVPIVIGKNSLENSQKIAKAIALATENKKVLVIATSSINNLKSFEEMSKCSKDLCSTIRECNIDFLFSTSGDSSESKSSFESVYSVFIKYGKEINSVTTHIYRLKNPTTLTNQRDFKVYISAGLYSSEAISKDISLDISDVEMAHLLKYTRQIIVDKLSGERNPIFIPNSLLMKNYGVHIIIENDSNVVIGSGAELFSNMSLKDVIESAVDYALYVDPIRLSTKESILENSTLKLVLLGKAHRILPDDEIPSEGLLFLKNRNCTSMEYYESNKYSKEKVLRDLCIKAGLLYNCWQNEESEIYHFTYKKGSISLGY